MLVHLLLAAAASIINKSLNWQRIDDRLKAAERGSVSRGASGKEGRKIKPFLLLLQEILINALRISRK